MTFRGWIHRVKVAAHAVWIGARDPEVPFAVRLFGYCVAAYALSPIDLIPDFIPILGLLDDAILVPFGVWLCVKMIPPALHAKHLAEAEAADARPISRTGAILIAVLWLLAALWLATLLYAVRYY